MLVLDEAPPGGRRDGRLEMGHLQIRDGRLDIYRLEIGQLEIGDLQIRD